MHICSIWLPTLALICCTASVQSQLCDSDSECDGEKCCPTGKCTERIIYIIFGCPCQVDKDCNSGERCLHRPPIGGFCSRPDESSTVTLQPTWESFTYEPYTYNHCISNGDCQGSHETCEDGQCVDDDSGGLNVRVVTIVPIIVIFVVLLCLGLLYSARQKARNQPILKVRWHYGVLDVKTNEREMQTGTNAYLNSVQSAPPYKQVTQLYDSYIETPRIDTSASPAKIPPGPVAVVEVKDDSCTP